MDAAIALAPEHLSLYLLEVYPNAPLKDDMARAQLVAGARRGRGGDVLTAMERLEAAGLRAIRDLERRAAGPRVAAQPQILDRRRVARLRLRRALDARRRPLEECVARPKSTSTGLSAAADRPPTVRRLDAEERLGDALFTGPAPGRGHRSGRDQRPLRRRRLGAGTAPSSSRFVDAGCPASVTALGLRLTRQGMLLAHEVMTVFV